MAPAQVQPLHDVYSTQQAPPQNTVNQAGVAAMAVAAHLQQQQQQQQQQQVVHHLPQQQQIHGTYPAAPPPSAAQSLTPQQHQEILKQKMELKENQQPSEVQDPATVTRVSAKLHSAMKDLPYRSVRTVRTVGEGISGHDFGNAKGWDGPNLHGSNPYLSLSHIDAH